MKKSSCDTMQKSLSKTRWANPLLCSRPILVCQLFKISLKRVESELLYGVRISRTNVWSKTYQTPCASQNILATSQLCSTVSYFLLIFSITRNRSMRSMVIPVEQVIVFLTLCVKRHIRWAVGALYRNTHIVQSYWTSISPLISDCFKALKDTLKKIVCFSNSTLSKTLLKQLLWSVYIHTDHIHGSRPFLSSVRLYPSLSLCLLELFVFSSSFVPFRLLRTVVSFRLFSGLSVRVCVCFKRVCACDIKASIVFTRTRIKRSPDSRLNNSKT